MARLTRGIIDHEKMDAAVKLFELREAGKVQEAEVYLFYIRRLNQILAYLDNGQPLPPL